MIRGREHRLENQEGNGGEEVATMVMEGHRQLTRKSAEKRRGHGRSETESVGSVSEEAPEIIKHDVMGMYLSKAAKTPPIATNQEGYCEKEDRDCAPTAPAIFSADRSAKKIYQGCCGSYISAHAGDERRLW